MDRLIEYPDVLNVEDIISILRIGRSSAYELVHSGEFHTVKVGRRILIYKDVLQRWLDGKDGNKGVLRCR
ncbi:helix-turn-helix domain-containing protein [Fictibacillus sp. 23RED33]|uniref:helix-turn-helix domain-containing protein n=1 Tax=Fictibacillus sp. 23RED33 TaxID=2745879 RepID=UPI0018CF1666|nr:helix-turn-helix domain-containing protein [Fictibacillus sp. 23RED33]MBH0175940.1 helix-turn-helix domain-containing protein [Fictibacillus sp. 23RED33]